MKTLKTLIFLLSNILICLVGFAQNEAQKWYFGNKAGLDFSTSPPTILLNSAMTATEGCASISNGAGNLLFYSDGMTVYDQTHNIMANGTGLMGNYSTTQSGIIVKQPGNTNIYYIFTQDKEAGPNGFRYSIVDMNLSAGLGSVTVLNTPLYTPSCEKITAVRHCNGVDVWVVSHDWNSNNFRTFLVNSAGVSTTPVISSIGIVVTGGISNTKSLGQMKISSDGKRLGLAVYGLNAPERFEIYDFDATTGAVSNPLVLPGISDAYGCEFSRDGTKFYGGRYVGGQIFQWDLCAGGASAIIASQFVITSTSTTNISSLQLGMDGKIYIAREGAQSLSVIQNPNAVGAACNYLDAGQSITPKQSKLGLPNFINSFITSTLAFTHTVSCSTVSFTAPPSSTLSVGCSSSGSTLIGIQWFFGSPSSGGANTSTLSNPVFIYPAAGNYVAKLVYYHPCSIDTVSLPINISTASPVLTVTGVMNICEGDQIFYTVSGASSYTWSNGSTATTVSFTPTATSVFSVIGTNTGTNSCVGSKSFTVNVSKCTGIEPGIFEDGLQIYPNPFTDFLTVETQSEIKLIIFNQYGNRLQTQNLPPGNHLLNMSRYSAGVYTIMCSDQKNSKAIRFVKVE